MPSDNTITLYKWMLSEFTTEVRGRSLQKIASYLSPLILPGNQVLDLCCGSGPATFWFEDQGARVTGLDFAPYMIALAREEVSKRNSSAEFIEADIFEYDFGQEHYDLVSCLGNSISDFPLSDFVRLVRKLSRALKPGGRFVLQYHDGSYPFMHGDFKPAGVLQEQPERISFIFKDYLPEIGAYVKIYHNESLGEEYERTGYIYTVPMVHVAVQGVLEKEQHIRLGEDHFLDIFVKPM